LPNQLRIPAFLLVLLLCLPASPAWAQEPLLVPSDTGHLSLTHSDAGLGVGEYFSAFGLQMGATAAYFGVTFAIIVATQMNRDSPSDMRAVLITAAALAPPILALPSSAVAHRTARSHCPRDRSWGWTYLAGVGGTALTLGAAGLYSAVAWVPNDDVGINAAALAGILVGGSLITAGLEVLVLNVTNGAQVTAVPLAFKGGGGLALAGSF